MLSVALCLVGCAAPDSGDPAAEASRASAAMDSVYAAFSAGYAALDAKAVGDLYAVDARYLPPGGEILQGRDTITARFARSFESARAAGERLEIRFDSDDRGASGDVGYDIGYYTLARFAGDSLLGQGRGKFLTVWRRGGDGRWRIHSDAYNGVP